MSKAQNLLEMLDSLFSTNEELVEVYRNAYGQFVDEEGNVYDDEDLVPFDERGKMKKMPPWMMMKGKGKGKMTPKEMMMKKKGMMKK